MKTKEKKKKTKTGLDILFVSIVVLLIGISGFFKLFDKLEYRVYDLMLSLKPAPVMNPDMMLVNIDDESIEQMGAWPWTRDVLADALIRMRELGAKAITFDIEYLSPSQLGINPDIIKTIPENFAGSRYNVTSLMYELSDSVANGNISPQDLPDMTYEAISDYIEPELIDLENSITVQMFRDNDEYFAKALRYFGNAWLTINAREVLLRVSPELEAFTRDNFLLSNVQDDDNLIPEGNKWQAKVDGQNPGYSPAMLSFMKNARGAGFTNVAVDTDGTRRRIELLQERDGKYIGQLLFAPMLNLIDAQKLVREKNTLTLCDVLIPGETERRDIVIPLDEHGRMLINWVKQKFKDIDPVTGEYAYFKYEPVFFLKYLDDIENSFISNMRILTDSPYRDENGNFLGYYHAANYLLNTYDALQVLKQSLLNDTYTEEGTLPAVQSLKDEKYQQLFDARAEFFADCANLFDGTYEQEVVDFLTKYITDENREDMNIRIDDVHNIFSVLKTDYDEYMLTFKLKKAKYNNAFCLIGNSASSTTDLGVTPFENLFPNVGTHANVFNTIITGQMIRPFSWWYSFIFSVILLFILLFTTRYLSVALQNIIGFIGMFFFPISCFALMVFKLYYIPVIVPTFVMIIGYLTITILRFVVSEQDKSFLRNAFSTYLSSDVVNEIVNDPTKLTLGGEEKNITAIFTDIRGFSTISEKVTPSQLVSFLNKYLTLLSDLILENKGTIDKYEGDAIIAFFGAPISFEDHAWKACYAAIRMKQAEKKFNEEMLANGTIPSAVYTRIGINTGDMVVGNMGTDKKMNYTMMGNAVNLAARLEGVNKVYRTWILVSDTTWEAANSGVNAGKILARRLDRVRVIGIKKPVQLYNIVGLIDELPQAEIDSVNLFHRGLDLYLTRDFVNARKLFDKASILFPEDEAPMVFATRCDEYIAKGVPDNWDGVLNMTTK